MGWHPLLFLGAGLHAFSILRRTRFAALCVVAKDLTVAASVVALAVRKKHLARRENPQATRAPTIASSPTALPLQRYPC